MGEQDIFGTSMCVGEMATRMVWSPHDHHRTFGGNDGDARGAQIPPILSCITCGACAHEKTRKRVRTSKLSSAKKVGKTKKRGKQNKNSKKN